jgi:AraC-like DNA-binding protein
MKLIYHEIGKDKMFKTWHAQDGYMLLLVYSDGGGIVSDASVCEMRRGTLALVAPHKYHYTMPSEPELYDRSKLFLSKEEAGSLFVTLGYSSMLDGSLVCAYLPEDVLSRVELSLSELNAAEPKKVPARLAVATAELLISLDAYAISKESGVSDSITRAVKYINENIFSDIGIDEIAAYISISKYHFCRCFKAAMGITVMEYILKTRIMLAKRMLEEGELSVSEISSRCAFSSVSYFCRVFKLETGLSPREYRRSVRPQL